LPADLALVPADAGFFLTLRVADIVEQEGIKRLLQQLAKYEDLAAGVAKWEEQFEEGFAVAPAEVARLTAIPPPGPLPLLPVSPLLLVTTTKPYSPDKVLRWLGPGARPRSHQGKSYHVAPSPRGTALHFLTDRILVFSNSEAALQSFLARAPGAGPPAELRSHLALADQRYQAAGGLDLQAAFVKVFFQSFRQGLLQGSGGMIPAELVRRLDGFADTRRTVLLFNIRSATLSGDKLQLRLRLTFADPECAQRRAADVRAVVDLMQKPLREMVRSIAKNPGGLDQARDVVPPEALKCLFQVYDQFSVALQDVEIKAEGNVVDVRLPDLAIDLAGVGTVVGEVGRVGANQARVTDAAHLLELGMAVEDYVAEHRRLPPAATAAQDGKPLLSWRVALLPYVGEASLYREFKLDEPWDGPHNKKLLGRMPGVFGPAGSASPYRVFLGSGTPFEDRQGTPWGEITGRAAHTVLIVAAAERVPWTKPEGLSVSPGRPLPNVGAVALFADGSVRRLPARPEEKEKALFSLLTRGGEKVDLGPLPPVTGAAVATMINDAKWTVIRQTAATPEQYRWALRLAEKACVLQPNDGNLLNTVGVAQYRVGRYRDALATLTRSDQLTSAKLKKSIPADLAFLAMSHHQLGHPEQALADLRRLREGMKEPANAKNEESRAFLREAEALIDGPPGGRKK
jgi:hypothetical protein